MLRQRNEQIQLTVRFADTFICVLAFAGAYWLRASTNFLADPPPAGYLESQAWILAASLAIHLLVYPLVGFYQSLRLKSIENIISMVVKAALFEFFILGTLVFLLQSKSTSRYLFVLFLAFNYGLILFGKLGARVLLSALRTRGYNFRKVLVVGVGRNAAHVVQTLRRNRHWGYVPIGFLSAPSSGASPAMAPSEGLPILGDLRELESCLVQHAVDEVYFAMDSVSVDSFSDSVQLCERLGIPARFPMGMFELSHSRATFNLLDGLPVVTFYTTLMTPTQALLKRTLDIVISVVGLLITACLAPWIAWRIRRESPGPVIFKQVRVGENGRRFKCYKFRTMGVDAEARKAELLGANQMDGPIFKIQNDPRITAFGAFLRKTSLDELPQFFNILRGDMSVVGTRPPTPDEVSQYDVGYRRRLSIRPGLTGLWQVSGRNQISRFEDILALDLEYIDRWSIWLDLRIIARTIWITFFRKGAY